MIFWLPFYKWVEVNNVNDPSSPGLLQYWEMWSLNGRKYLKGQPGGGMKAGLQKGNFWRTYSLVSSFFFIHRSILQILGV